MSLFLGSVMPSHPCRNFVIWIVHVHLDTRNHICEALMCCVQWCKVLANVPWLPGSFFIVLGDWLQNSLSLRPSLPPFLHLPIHLSPLF